MDAALYRPDPADDEVRMGSEYTDAKTYLAQTPRPMPRPTVRRKSKSTPQHGSNDSDFGMTDRKAE